MLRVVTLGGLWAERDGVAVASLKARRRPLALLAFVAASGDRGVHRDRIAALFWPESDEGSASNAMRQTLHVLRRESGQSDLFLGTTELRLNAQAAVVDAEEFEAAAARGDAVTADALYSGAFLDGIRIEGAPDLEHWIESRRAALEARQRSVLEVLAARAREDGDHHAAVGYCRRRAALVPLDAVAAMDLMRALVAVGDCDGALQHASLHARLREHEIGASADPDVVALAAELAHRRSASRERAPEDHREASASSRRPPVAGPVALQVSAQPDDPGDAGIRLETKDPTRAIHNGLPSQSLAAWHGSIRRRLPPRAGAAAAIASLLVLGGAALELAPDRDVRAVRGEVPSTVAVFPFGVTDTSLAFLREGMVDLLAHDLTGEAGPRALQPRLTLGAGGLSEEEAIATAQRLGASHVIRGTVVGTAAHVVVTATMLPVLGASGGGSPVDAKAEGPVDSLGGVVDRLVAQLLAARAGEGRTRLPDLARRPLPALRAYLSGQNAYRGGKLAQAGAHFREAVELDSTFALASLGLARSGAFTALGGSWRADSVMLRAYGLRRALAPRDRALFDALVGPIDPAPRTAGQRLATWRHALEQASDDLEALYGYADHLFHEGEYLGIPQARETARAMFERAVALDSNFALPLGHLLELAAADGDTARMRAIGARYAALAPTAAPEAAGYVAWRSATARGDSSELRRLRGQFGTMPTQSLDRIVSFAQLDGGVGMSDADRAAAVLVGRSDVPLRRTSSLFVAHTLHLNRRRWNAARATRAMLRALEPVGPGLIAHLTDTRVLAITDELFAGEQSGEGATAVATLRAELRGERTRVSGEPKERAAYASRVCAVGLWDAAHGAADAARAAASRLRVLSPQDSAAHFAADPALCVAMLDAWVASAERRPEAPARLAALDSVMALGPRGFGAQFGNLIVASLAERSGDVNRALRAAARRRHYPADGAVYLSAYLRLEARLAASLGDADRARAARQHLGRLEGMPYSAGAPAQP